MQFYSRLSWVLIALVVLGAVALALLQGGNGPSQSVKNPQYAPSQTTPSLPMQQKRYGQ